MSPSRARRDLGIAHPEHRFESKVKNDNVLLLLCREMPDGHCAAL